MYRELAAIAVGAALSLGAMSNASAGGACGGGNCGCGAVVEVVQPCAAAVESYLINQGPVLSGPGHYLGQLEEARPCCDQPYPYVGFVYSGYPYGLDGPATGYPRGFYSPYTGYPYGEPYPYYGRRAHWHVRHHGARSARVHYRATHRRTLR